MPLGAVTYTNAGPADAMTLITKLVIAIRDTRPAFISAIDQRLGESWEARVKRFIEKLPGASKVAMVLTPEVRNDQQRVAAFYLRVLTAQLPAGLTLSQALTEIERAFPDAQLYRATVVPPLISIRPDDLNAEIGEATAEDVKRDEQEKKQSWWERLKATIKALGTFVVVVLVLLLALVIASRTRRDATAPLAESKS